MKYLGVYGTLRSDHPTEFGKGMRQLIKDASAGERPVLHSVRGYKLYDMGHYPAAFFTNNSDDHITVQEWAIEDDKWDDLIARLDLYEGRDYMLTRVEALLYMYEWNGEGRPPSNTVIEGGNWVAYCTKA